MSFDDDTDEDLCVFSGNDLLVAHYDVIDLDWQEVAERSAIDARRGLVIAQVTALEDLVDEFILYLADEEDASAAQRRLAAMTIGRRISAFESALVKAGLLTSTIEALLVDVRSVVTRRNELAHGSIWWQPTTIQRMSELAASGEIEMVWLLVDRRTRKAQRLSMAGLRQDVYDAIGCFSAMLHYAEEFVRIAPRPVRFAGGAYLAAAT